MMNREKSVFKTDGDNEGLSRRAFLGGAATVAVGAALVATGCAPASSTPEGGGDQPGSSGQTSGGQTPAFLQKPAVPDSSKISQELDCDVLVIGTGTAGNPAVLAAVEAGAKVIGIDKGGPVGYVPGSQDYGVIGSKIHDRLGWGWAPKTDIINQLMKDMCYRPNPRLFDYWYKHSGETFDWLLDGVDYQLLSTSLDEPTQDVFVRPKYFPALAGYDWKDEYYPYFHGTLMILPGSQVLMENAAKRAEEAGVQFHYGMYAEQLITDGSGRVVGAYAHDVDGVYTKFNASKGVVLSCGDIGGSREMMEYYVPHAAQFMCFYGRVDTQGAQSNTGDGHRMAMWAGASMELGPYAPMTHHMGGPLGVDAFLQLNAKGERFMNEDIPGQNLQDQLSRQPKGFSWQIVDDKWREQLSVQGTGHGFINSWMSEEEAAQKPWIFDAVFLGVITDKLFFEGNPGKFMSPITCQADTIEELAEKMELPAATVAAEIKRYNELCAKGHDDDFGKVATRMLPVSTPPFYATKFEQTSMLVCCGGIKCDEQLRALDADDEIVPGLYVAGNTMGGRFLVEYPVTVAGISLGTAITFGRLAGENAAKGV
jgi:hypothetical protein